MIKLDFIIEDLSLYGFIMKFGRKPVFIRVNLDKACLADSERFIAEHIVRHLWKRKQLVALFFPKALYRGITLVMLPLSVLLTPFQKMLVELFKANDRGDRNESVSSDIADLVLNIAFLIA